LRGGPRLSLADVADLLRRRRLAGRALRELRPLQALGVPGRHAGGGNGGNRTGGEDRTDSLEAKAAEGIEACLTRRANVRRGHPAAPGEEADSHIELRLLLPSENWRTAFQTVGDRQVRTCRRT